MLTPEESEKLKAQSGDLLAGLLTLTDELKRLNVEAWAAEDWAKYQQLSEAGDNAFLANDFSTSAASYSEAKALGESLKARAGTTLAASLDSIPGLIEHGLFVGMVHLVLVGEVETQVVRRMTRSAAL